MKPKKRKFLFYFLLLILCCLSGVRTLFPERLPVKVYTSADGLGSGFVDNVMRDSRGFIWACTRDGLSRFDGSRFVNYRIGEKNAPPGIENIYETRAGIYYITTTGGTYRFDPQTVSASDEPEPRLNAEFVIGQRGQFVEDETGNLWLVSGSIYRAVTKNGKTEFQEEIWDIPPQNSTFTVYDVDKSPDGSFWAYTSWGIVRRMANGRLAVYRFDRSEYGNGGVSTLMADRSGRVWVTFHNLLFVVKPEPAESFSEPVTVKFLEPTSVIPVKPEESVPLPETGGEIFQFTNPDYIGKLNTRRIFQSSDGNYWISTQNYLLQIENGILRVHSSDEGLPNSMGRMTEDAAGNLWVGGYNGLTRLDRRGLITYSASDGAFSSQFNAVTQSADGELYFATSDTRITGFDGARLRSVRPAIPANAMQTWTSRFIFRSSDGDFWVLTTGSLYRFSGVKDFRELEGRQPTKIYGIGEGLKSDILFQIYEDSTGDIWVSTRGVKSDTHGLARLKKGADRFQAFSEAEGFPLRKTPSSFAEDRRGNLWLGFYEGGLARFDGERFEVLSDAEDFPAKGVISDLLLDARGRLWISSSNSGIFRVDETNTKTPVYAALTTDDGLASNNVRTLAEDRLGRIYAGTASGVDRISPDSGRIKHYSVSDGLAADFVVDSLLDRDGNLWFVTNNGVSRLVPLPDEKTPAPRIFIGGLRVAGTKLAVSELGSAEITTAELAHTENNLEIEFFALDFRAGETLRYQYRLEGADAGWSPPSEQRARAFANLSPGSYRFLVRAVNSEGAASETPAVVSFKILPPIWARWWFILISALLVSAVIVSLYRFRITHLREINAALSEAKSAEENLRRAKEERLAELEQVRSRIATDLHDDIGASLTQITVLSEVALAQSKGNGANESLSKITGVSNELVEAMSDIVWSINPSKDHLSDLTQRMRRFASDVLSAKGIVFNFRAPDVEHEIKVGANLRREVFLIFKESVNNVVKHSGATEVRIELKISGAALTMRVSDNGCGFVPESLFTDSLSSAEDYGGNGLTSMKKRAAEMRGTFEVKSAPPTGTSVFLSLPLENFSPV